MLFALKIHVFSIRSYQKFMFFKFSFSPELIQNPIFIQCWSWADPKSPNKSWILIQPLSSKAGWSMGGWLVTLWSIVYIIETRHVLSNLPKPNWKFTRKKQKKKRRNDFHRVSTKRWSNSLAVRVCSTTCSHTPLAPWSERSSAVKLEKNACCVHTLLREKVCTM